MAAWIGKKNGDSYPNYSPQSHRINQYPTHLRSVVCQMEAGSRVFVFFLPLFCAWIDWRKQLSRSRIQCKSKRTHSRSLFFHFAGTFAHWVFHLVSILHQSSTPKSPSFAFVHLKYACAVVLLCWWPMLIYFSSIVWEMNENRWTL